MPSVGALARRIRMYYPWIVPELNEEGHLVGISLAERPDGASQETYLAQEAAQRGYQRRHKVRPRNLMPFLSVPKDAPNPGCAGRVEGLEPLKRKERYL